MNLEYLIQSYGYLAVLVGTFMEGETILILAAFASYQGYLALPWVVLSAWCGACCGDQMFFFLGRKWSGRVLERFPSWRDRAVRVHKFLDRFQPWAIFLYRYMYGFRSITPFVIGNGPMPAVRFIPLNMLSVFLWAAVVGSLGYLFANTLGSVLGSLKKFEMIIAGVIALAGFSFWYFGLRHEKKKSGRL
ncbi:MAG TPA: DedA family protein [Thermodesulfobacteriota bacterium]|nr:DedA family protein [Thermodesulfobacteriota bacterium]